MEPCPNCGAMCPVVTTDASETFHPERGFICWDCLIEWEAGLPEIRWPHRGHVLAVGATRASRPKRPD